ncbi:hypothetical protein [Rhodococcus artemisiae]|uniref:Uncharacterized protein n=1 Tax=Rhodococcus artemisiae TaxID=714159 RepID=A0ABU7LBS3_9NOCA|nr:hypothetical protein [Rhodococcus artemisiae]MEE2058996.1 hypothetical protein [Rhodococcus artemisiae]
MVGVGLSTAPITQQVIARIRGCVANPADAAALATVLFTGATYRELTFLPRRTATGDTAIFPGTPDVDHPADLGVWGDPTVGAAPAAGCRRLPGKTHGTR